MGKVLKILGVVFLVLVVAIVALLVWAHGKGEKEMTTFFQAVETGQPEKVRALMAPELAKEFDPPIFKMWLDAFNERMGEWHCRDFVFTKPLRRQRVVGTVWLFPRPCLFEFFSQ